VEAADDNRAGMVSATHLEVRRAGPADAPAIAAVLHESFVEFKALYTEGGFAATTLGTEQVLTRMREGPIWVALREGAVMGTVAAVVKNESVYVRGMAVLPAARATGAGTVLLQHVEGWASGQGCGRLFLSTTPFLSSAIRLYERYGFRRTDEGLHDLFGTPLFTMEKAVERAPPSG
jgi:N-acetylglutamate synthase-like GNAT family acetyltransferase